MKRYQGYIFSNGQPINEKYFPYKESDVIKFTTTKQHYKWYLNGELVFEGKINEKHWQNQLYACAEIYDKGGWKLIAPNWSLETHTYFPLSKREICPLIIWILKQKEKYFPKPIRILVVSFFMVSH